MNGEHEESSQSGQSWTINQHKHKIANGKAKLHTTRKHLFISTQYYDKHGVPPTKRLFKVAMLDPFPNSLVLGESLEIRDYQLWYGALPMISQENSPYSSIGNLGLVHLFVDVGSGKSMG
ncbi:hypothetical protein Tco_1523444 [Tanacetum coccineum]